MLSGVSLTAVGGILAIAGLVGSLLGFVLSRGLREALAASNESVKSLLTSRDIEREQYKAKIAALEVEVAAKDVSIQILKSEVLEGIVGEVRAQRKPRPKKAAS